MFERYFPLGIAEGEAFLGRKDEINRLQNNVKTGIHTLLLAPRRYGKTSLAKHVVSQLHYPWVEIDLFIAQNEFSVEQKILKAVQSLSGQIGSPDYWLNLLVKFFKKANKTWTVGIKGVQLELIPENHKDIPENILDALSALEHILEKKKKRAVLFIDEFQEIARIKMNREIEGAIRHFAQRSKYLVFIFSGSSRHMLKHMFGDKTRPLYALCDEINVERLTPQDYKPYFNKVAQYTWKKKLPEEVFHEMMILTECHPRYVYLLCIFLWDFCLRNKSTPKGVDVKKIWHALLQDKIKDFREALSKRAMSQIKLLALIALGHSKELTGQVSQAKLGISGSAITQSLDLLENDEYIEKCEDNSYHIIDPILKNIFIQCGADYFL